MFDLVKVASEIASRIYLTIGVYPGARPLRAAAPRPTVWSAASAAAIGRGWHRLVYVIALLAVVPLLMQSSSIFWEPSIMAGFDGWLMGYRLWPGISPGLAVRGRLPLVWCRRGRVTAAVLTAFR